MTIPTTTHKNYQIIFDQSSDEWTCGQLALTDKSLAKLKIAIDKAGKERRRVNVDAFYLEDNYHRGINLRKCTIVLLRDGDRKADVKFPKESAQSQVDIENLYALDQQPKLDAYIAAKKAAEKADDNARKLQERLKPLTAKAVREAVVRQAEDNS